MMRLTLFKIKKKMCMDPNWHSNLKIEEPSRDWAQKEKIVSKDTTCYIQHRKFTKKR
jgi:hypothetical protein